MRIRKLASVYSAIGCLIGSGLATSLLFDSTAKAGCNPFGCSNSTNAECNPFGCPNGPLGRACTPFGCPASPQPEPQYDRGVYRSTPSDYSSPSRRGRSVGSLVYECAGILQSSSIRAGFSAARAERLCESLVGFDSISECSSYLLSSRVREGFNTSESIRICEAVVQR